MFTLYQAIYEVTAHTPHQKLPPSKICQKILKFPISNVGVRLALSKITMLLKIEELYIHICTFAVHCPLMIIVSLFCFLPACFFYLSLSLSSPVLISLSLLIQNRHLSTGIELRDKILHRTRQHPCILELF